MISRLFRRSAGWALVFGMASGGAAEAQTTQAIDLPAQALSSAVVELSAETGLQIIAPGRLVEGKEVPRVSGKMLPLEALDRLLEGTGLRYRSTGSGAVVLVASQNANPSNSGTLALGNDLVGADIIVEGERVLRSLFETPSSVVVFDEEALENTPGVQTVDELFWSIPNVTPQFGASEGPTIRGQATIGPIEAGRAFLAGTQPRATTTVDGRPASYFENIFGTTSIWDVGSVEVFRGPQTTSQGINSIAGAFIVNTNDPSFDFEAAGRAQFGNLGTRQISGMFNVPLVEDELALRVTLDYGMRDRYNALLVGPGLISTKDDEQYDNLTGRIKLRYEPADLPDLSLQLTYSYAETAGPQTDEATLPFDNRITAINAPGAPAAFLNNTDVVIFDLEYGVSEAVSIRNRATWSDYDVIRFVGSAPALTATIGGRDLSNELLVDLTLMDGDLTGLLGVYYRDVSDVAGVITDFGLGPTESSFTDDRTSLGILGEFTYAVTDDFDVTAGLRYQRDTQNRVGTAFPGSPISQRLNLDGSYSAFLPKVALGYDVTDDLRVGAVVSRGFNPGGTSFSFGSLFAGTPAQFDFDEETLWNYEVFARGNFLDNRLFVAANAFYTDFDDTQFEVVSAVPAPVLFDRIVRNADDARSYGAEVQVDFQATDDLRLFGAAGYLETEYRSFPAAVQNFVGNEFARAPSFSGNFGVEYRLLDELTIGGDVRFTTGYFSDEANTPVNEVDSYTIVNLKADWQPYDGVTVFGYMNNVFDTDIVTQLRNNGTTGTPVPPREFGLGGRVEF